MVVSARRMKSLRAVVNERLQKIPALLLGFTIYEGVQHPVAICS